MVEDHGNELFGFLNHFIYHFRKTHYHLPYVYGWICFTWNIFYCRAGSPLPGLADGKSAVSAPYQKTLKRCSIRLPRRSDTILIWWILTCRCLRGWFWGMRCRNTWKHSIHKACPYRSRRTWCRSVSRETCLNLDSVAARLCVGASLVFALRYVFLSDDLSIRIGGRSQVSPLRWLKFLPSLQ